MPSNGVQRDQERKCLKEVGHLPKKESPYLWGDAVHDVLLRSALRKPLLRKASHRSSKSRDCKSDLEKGVRENKRLSGGGALGP